MPLTEAHLRYLLAIYEVSQTHLDISSRSIAEKLGVTKPSVVRIMNLLMERGMIVKEHYGKIYMTDRGIFVAKEVKKQLEDKGFRCEVDDRSEKIGYKIREAQLEKVPYMVVVGDKDIENNTISIRKRKEGDLGAMTVEQFLEKIVPDRDNKVID